MQITKTQPHNPYCRLIETTLSTPDGYVDIVYGEENDGSNKGLEVYYFKDVRFKIGQQYSRRWLIGSIPKKYSDIFLRLAAFAPLCPAGHKLIVS